MPRRLRARSAIDADTPSKRGARDHVQMIATIQGAPSRSEIRMLFNIPSTLPTKTAAWRGRSTSSRNLHAVGSIPAGRIEPRSGDSWSGAQGLPLECISACGGADRSRPLAAAGRAAPPSLSSGVPREAPTSRSRRTSMASPGHSSRGHRDPSTRAPDCNVRSGDGERVSGRRTPGADDARAKK